MGKKKPVEKEPVREGDPDIAANGLMGNRVFCSISKLISLPDFENIRVEFGESRVVQNGESFEETRIAIRAHVWMEITEMVGVVEEAMKEE